jgi:hypothetical protein
MKVHFRGGPKDRKRMIVDGEPVAFEVVKPNYGIAYSVDTHSPLAVAPAPVRGRYSRTMQPTKKGVYYFVWMGWDE